ncbi:MAG: DUF1015 domain-containing protein [Lachnospiraceae bacterium]|nr:DUF1015 domain-containing protein [Lachnospiraceae bacterium]
MAKIRPFKAIRPTEELADKIAALPYDVYNRQEAKEVVAGDNHTFLRIDRAETQFSDDVDTYDARVYQKAKELLLEQIEKGEFITEEKPCFYLYELIMDGRSQTGIVGCASIDDYVNGIIKKHENTRADKEEDRIRHVDTLDAQTGPIFLAYRDRAELKELIQKYKSGSAVYDFTSDDGISHRVFVIEDEQDMAAIAKAFEEMGNVYIADGHHRCASAVKVGLKRREEHPDYTGEEEFNYFLSVLFADSELMIMDYNRVVKDLNGLTEEAFLAALAKDFAVVEEKGKAPVRPDKKGQIGMYLNDTWYLLTIKDTVKTTDPVKGLDVSLLQDYVLEPMLGIADPKTDKRIDFVGGIRGLLELERRVHTDMQVAFSMYPTSIGELFAVADAGLLMPPKSTWFEPKLRSGLFIHSLQ